MHRQAPLSPRGPGPFWQPPPVPRATGCSRPLPAPALPRAGLAPPARAHLVPAAAAAVGEGGASPPPRFCCCRCSQSVRHRRVAPFPARDGLALCPWLLLRGPRGEHPPPLPHRPRDGSAAAGGRRGGGGAGSRDSPTMHRAQQHQQQPDISSSLRSAAPPCPAALHRHFRYLTRGRPPAPPRRNSPVAKATRAGPAKSRFFLGPPDIALCTWLAFACLLRSRHCPKRMSSAC